MAIASGARVVRIILITNDLISEDLAIRFIELCAPNYQIKAFSAQIDKSDSLFFKC